MPTDVKAIVSVVVALVALGLVYWSASPIRPDFGKFVIFTAAFFVRNAAVIAALASVAFFTLFSV